MVDLTGYNVAIWARVNGIGKVLAASFACCGESVFASNLDAQALDTFEHKGMRPTPAIRRSARPSSTPP
jgi:hypothetical protein